MVLTTFRRSAGNGLVDSDEVFQRHSSPLPLLIAVTAMIANFFLLGAAMRTLPIGTVYGVLIRFGAIGTCAASVILFKEPLGFQRALSLVLIVAGVFGLKTSAIS